MTTNELPDMPRRADECPNAPATIASRPRRRAPGQALVEYVLIVVLVSIAVVAVLTLTGPIIGNVFSNVVYNLLEQTSVPYNTLDANAFWHYVTVVASYVPPTAVVQTYTPAPVTPSATSSITSTVNSTNTTLTPTATSTATPTVGPSPTLTDIPYTPPFINSADNAILWNEPFYDAFAQLGWTATYYTGASNAGVGGTANGTHVCPTTPASSTPCLSDVYYTGALAPSYPGVNEIIYKGTAPFEGRSYEVTISVGAGDSAVFKVNGSPVVSKDNTGGASTVTATTSNYAPGAGASYALEVDYYTSNPNSTGNEVKLVFSTLSDYAGNSYCNWQTLNPGHGPTGLSWQDGAGGNYQISSNCNLRLRGWIDLSQGGINHPSISFYDEWSLGPSASAFLGVRQYNYNGTTFAGANQPWQWIPIHTGGQKGSNWSLETFDLTNFGTGGSYVSFTNQKIEIAFKVVNPDPLPADTDRGWFVDDIRIGESAPTVYSIPIMDDFDGQTGQVQWSPDCSWAVTTNQNYPDGTPGHSYGSNPGTIYNPSSDCSLYLGPSNGGVVDLTSGNPATQLAFENKYQINGTTTALTVEYVSASNHGQNPIPWTPLTPNGSSNPWVAKGTMTTGNTWQQEVFNLGGLPPDKYYFRFRLVADSTSPGDIGWYLDNIQWRLRPVTIAGIPWADTLNNADNWTLSDKWGLTASASGGPGPDGLPHTMPYALTDSPGGAQYDTTGNANNIAQLNTQIDIGSSSLCPATFDPVLTFWSHWSVASGATLSVDFSQDGGTTWNPGGSPLWQFMYGSTSDPFQTTVTGANYNTNLAWRRFMVDLKAYACQNKTIMIRFHLQVPNGSQPADGWYVDDVAFYDGSPAEFGQPAFANSIACQPNGSCSPAPINVGTQPFLDGAENPLQGGWYMGSNWQVVSSTTNPPGSVHSGQNAWAIVPPATNYASPQDGIMELAPAIDLSSFSSNGQKPVLSFWTRYSVASGHKVEAQVMTMSGNANLTTSAAGWITPPQPVWIAPTPGGSANTFASNTNLGWTQQLMDLSPFAGKVIRLRFRLDGLTSATPTPGMWLDDVYVGALSQMAGYVNHPLSPVFQENFPNLNNWVAEGDWQQTSDWGPYYYAPPSDHFTPVAYDYGNGNLNPDWDANYYHYFTTDPTSPEATGDAWTEPTGQNICSTTTNQQISNFTMVGGTAGRTTSGMPRFSWTDGTPVVNGSTTSGATVSGTGNGFQFTSVSDPNQRLIKVYVGATNATASVSVWLSGNQAGTTQTFSFTAGSTTNKEYDITFSSAIAQTLVFQITATGGSAQTVDLEAAEVQETTTTTATDAISVAAPTTIANGQSINLTLGENDNTSGTTDWTQWGYSTTKPFNRRALQRCVNAITHQQAAQVNFTWDSTHIPANAGGLASWQTDALDYEWFAVVFKRRMTIDPGEYRFWANADDGVRLLIDGTIIPPSDPNNAPVNPALPYPWVSAGPDGWTDQSPHSYFYDFIMPGPSGQHTIEVDYYQHTGGAQVKFLTSETTNLLHSNSLGSNYSANQNTSAFINGYITVPASTTKTTSVGFYERFDNGSNGSSGDPMYVAISIDGGFTWYNLTSNVIDSDPDSPNFGNPVTYGYNHPDSSNGVDPFTTYQNWHFHAINLSTAMCGGSRCISTSQPTQITLKFQLDARNSVAQFTGWYITNLTVIQN